MVMVCVVVSSAAAVMLGQKSRSSAPDPPALPGWLGSSGAAVVAVCVLVAAVCACAAVLLYRAARGRSEEENTKDTAEEREQRAAESTEISDDGGSEECETDSSEAAVILSSENHTEEEPSGFPEDDLRETSHEKLNDSTEDDLSVSLTSDMTESGVLTHCSEHSECCSGHVKRDAAESVKVEADLYDYRYDSSKAVEDEFEDSLKESTCDTEEFEAESPGDVDEPSETESAQETMEAKNVPVHKCQSVEDLQDNTLLAQDVVGKPVKMERFADEQLNTNREATKLDDEKSSKKGFEDSTDHRLIKIKEFDCCCYEEQSDILNYNLASEKTESVEDQVKRQQDCDGRINSLGATLSRYDPVLNNPQQNFLGFTVPSLPCIHIGQVQLADINRGKSAVDLSSEVKATRNKNEISIMEAIMDSNEWLSTGPPDTRDLPWLTQTQSNTSDIFKKNNTSLITPATSEPTADTFWLQATASSNPSYGLIDKEDQSHKENSVAPEDTVIGDAEEAEDDDIQSKKIAAVSPMPQMVQVRFRVHYITHSPSQILAVTGNQQELGNWESFVTLQRAEDWFWANTVMLPTENQVEWKFVMVEDGKIRRWEECANRRLVVTGQEEEIKLDKSWGFL